jgi:hypothetical protein
MSTTLQAADSTPERTEAVALKPPQNQLSHFTGGADKKAGL